MATDPQRDAPWVMRTYSGHSTARASNELYRTNLAKGQTGLSIAFDLPTQTGYDPDAPEAAGEVGKVGVPVAHLGHMKELLEGIPVEDMNTSMTINATAAWLLGLYVAHAQDKGVDPALLAGTTQNDIVKEYLSRGTYIFPPGPSLRLTVDTIAYTVRQAPKWNPINVCSYHLQEAGATPVQEIAYALATAIGVLDGVRASGKIEDAELPAVVGRISFFVNSSVRFVEETCKMRAFTQLWDRICRERYGVEDPKLRRFRYGVQVNSLGLTEQQPENNVQRIVLESLGVTLSKSARARAMQLPAWNEALGLPRPWDQQWSLRMQQVLAFESDLLEYDDIFEGSVVDRGQDGRAGRGGRGGAGRRGGARRGLRGDRRAQAAARAQPGRAGPAHRDGRAEGGRASTASPRPRRPRCSATASSRTSSRSTTASRRSRSRRWSAGGPGATPRRCAPPSTSCAGSPTTTGPAATSWRRPSRWPTPAARPGSGPARCARSSASSGRPPASAAGWAGAATTWRPSALRTRALAERTGGPPRLLVAKPGLDGHSNGAEQIAVAARDAGFEVIYQGIRLTPAQIVAAARDEDVDIVGLSILSGSHLELVPDVLDRLRAAGSTAAVVVGGIIPPDDAELLLGKGVASVYTPKDYSFDRIMEDLVALAERQRAATPAVSRAISRQVTATAPSSMACRRRASGTS